MSACPSLPPLAGCAPTPARGLPVADGGGAHFHLLFEILRRRPGHRPGRLPAPKAAATGKRVGIIGGGPGGLTAAYYLSLKGHRVTIVDAMPQMGGMLPLRHPPEYRLPKRVWTRRSTRSPPWAWR